MTIEIDHNLEAVPLEDCLFHIELICHKARMHSTDWETHGEGNCQRDDQVTIDQVNLQDFKIASSISGEQLMGLRISSLGAPSRRSLEGAQVRF